MSDPYSPPTSPTRSKEDAPWTFDVEQMPIQVTQLITIAMIAGLTFYIGFVINSGQFEPKNFNVDQSVLIGIAIAMGSCLFAFVVPMLVSRQSFKAIDPAEPSSHQEKIYQAFQVQLIAGLGLLDGAAFYNIFQFSNSGSYFSLITAGALILVMAMRFPTRRSLSSWVVRNISIGFQR